MTRDHVCDMEVEESSAVAAASYAGDEYYFCSEACKQKFVSDPEKYVSREESSAT